MTDPYADDTPTGKLSLGFVRQLWPHARPYRRGFAACLGILLVSFGLELLGPFLLGRAIDGPLLDTTAPTAERTTRLLWFAFGFLAATGAGAWLGYVYGRLTAWNGQRVVRDLRRRLFEHLLHLPLSFHERNPAGKLTTRVANDVENLNELIATGVLQSVFDLLKIVGVLVALCFLDLRLALFTLAATPIVVVLSVVFRKNAERAYRAVRGRLALQNAFTAELVGGVRTTRAGGREATIAARYAARNADTSAAWFDTVRHFSVFFSLVDFCLRATSVGLLWFGGSAVLEGNLQAGQFVQFWLYFNLLTGPIRELGEKYNVLQAAFASCERVFTLLAEPRFPAGGRLPTAARGAARIEFADVSFAYGSGPAALHRVSFVAEPGHTVAIVGPTGAGKSTLLSLVARLRDVTSGAVRVDGVDVRDLQLGALRRRIAYVAQDLFLFTGSVLDNLRLFDPQIDEARVWRALETVGAAEFVRRLDGGLHAAVQERGGTFSQGERQLLAFARALVAEPDVLVLDEATSSIDSATEARLQQALRAAMRGRTAIVVAHRLSTVRAADRILVLERGEVREAGTHAELTMARGIYHRMLERAGLPH